MQETLTNMIGRLPTNAEFPKSWLSISENEGIPKHYKATFNEVYPDIMIRRIHPNKKDEAYMKKVLFDKQLQNALAHTHNCFVLIHCAEGECYEWIEGSTVLLTAGEMVLLSPNTQHFFLTSRADTTIVIYNINSEYMSNSVAPGLSENMLFCNFFLEFFASKTLKKFMVFKNAKSGQTEQILLELYEEYLKRDALYQITMKLLVQRLLIELARTQVEYIHASSQPPVRKMMAYISEHYQNVTIQKVASVFGYHPNYVSAMMQKTTGRTFLELRTDYRMQRANIYLKNTDMSIEDVALACGYRDRATFYRAYKNKYHCTPKAYQSILVESV